MCLNLPETSDKNPHEMPQIKFAPEAIQSNSGNRYETWWRVQRNDYILDELWQEIKLIRVSFFYISHILIWSVHRLIMLSSLLIWLYASPGHSSISWLFVWNLHLSDAIGFSPVSKMPSYESVHSLWLYIFHWKCIFVNGWIILTLCLILSSLFA